MTHVMRQERNCIINNHEEWDMKLGFSQVMTIAFILLNYITSPTRRLGVNVVIINHIRHSSIYIYIYIHTHTYIIYLRIYSILSVLSISLLNKKENKMIEHSLWLILLCFILSLFERISPWLSTTLLTFWIDYETGVCRLARVYFQ